MAKWLITGLIALSICRLPAQAQNEGGLTISTRHDVSVRVNGRNVDFKDVQPTISAGRVMMPIRWVLRTLPSMSLVWDPVQRTVSGAYLDRTVRLQIGSRFAKVNGRQVAMDVPAYTDHGRTMIPLRFLSEALGAVVTWNEADSLVSVVVPTLNVPGSVAESAATSRRFFRAETSNSPNQKRPIVAARGAQRSERQTGAQQPQMTDEETLAALGRQTELLYNQLAANQTQWQQDYGRFLLWSNLQTVFNSVVVVGGMLAPTGAPQIATMPGNPIGWLQWEAALATYAQRDQTLRQDLSVAYSQFLVLFRKLRPGETAPMLPPLP